MGPPPRSFAADAHDCIMVRPYGRNDPRPPLGSSFFSGWRSMPASPPAAALVWRASRSWRIKESDDDPRWRSSEASHGVDTSFTDALACGGNQDRLDHQAKLPSRSRQAATGFGWHAISSSASTSALETSFLKRARTPAAVAAVLQLVGLFLKKQRLTCYLSTKCSGCSLAAVAAVGENGLAGFCARGVPRTRCPARRPYRPCKGQPVTRQFSSLC